jgi:hypothetical protein
MEHDVSPSVKILTLGKAAQEISRQHHRQDFRDTAKTAMLEWEASEEKEGRLRLARLSDGTFEPLGNDVSPAFYIVRAVPSDLPPVIPRRRPYRSFPRN